VNTTSENCDVLVIGSGMSGMAATFFAIERGLNTIQIGQSSPLQFYSGFFDVMAVHPIKDKKTWDNPWDGITQLCKDIPEHPYALLTKDQILQAFGLWFELLKQLKMPYSYMTNQNIPAITPIGTSKLTHAVPQAMWTGISAMLNHQKALVVDIDGLKGFSGQQIKENLHDQWPELETIRITFPKASGETYANHMASAIESPDIHKQLINAIIPHAHRVQCIGFPAILGSYHHQDLCKNIESLLGKPVFEIPTLPPCMPGIRLRNALTHELAQKGGTLYQTTIHNVEPDGKYGFIAHTANHKIYAKNIVLAAGRFMGKGLNATRTSIKENLFNLPVVQPESRRQWHHKQFFHQQGHDIHQAGICVDQSFRPINEKGKIVYDHLFAAGSILAKNDWMRHKCGAGVAVASAFGAVHHIQDNQ